MLKFAGPHVDWGVFLNGKKTVTGSQFGSKRRHPWRFFPDGRKLFLKPLLVGVEFPFPVCNQAIFVGTVVLQHADGFF